MDVLFDAFPLLLFVAYVVLRWLTRAAQGRVGAERPGAADAAEPDAVPMDLEALMRALGAEAIPPGPPSHEPTPAEAPAARRPPALPTASARKGARPEPAAVARETFYDEGHFHDDDRFYDDTIGLTDAAMSHPPIPPAAPPPRRTARLATRLRDPSAARDAFVFQTVFGRRGGRHGSS